jgi:ABC-type Fe3+-hydroxamate transport system substrate-binding protein
MCDQKNQRYVRQPPETVGYDVSLSEIEDFAKIFNVEDRGQAVIADFKKREADLRKEFVEQKISPLFSGSAHPLCGRLRSA